MASPEGGDPSEDDARRYAHYLLELRDDLDRLEATPNGRVPATMSVVGGVLLVTILVLAGAPVWLIGSFSALTLAPLLYLLGPARAQSAERRALVARIRQIEGRRERIESAGPGGIDPNAGLDGETGTDRQVLEGRK